jgi:hypothetical protein
MKAEQFEARINELLDRRIPPGSDPELRRLAGDSDELRLILASYSLLLEAVEKLPQPAASDDLAPRLVAAASSTTAEPRVLEHPMLRYWILGLGAAAALLVAIPLVSLVRHDVAQFERPVDSRSMVADRRPTASEPAQLANSTTSQRPTSGDDAKVRQPSPVEAKELARYAEFARQTTSLLSDLALLISEVSVNPHAVIEDAKQNRPNRKVVEQVSEGLAPLANSAASAFDFLLEVLPAVDAERS